MMDKEIEKLADLEFEYDLARMYSDDLDVIRLARRKMEIQREKIKRMEAEQDETTGEEIWRG